MPALRAIRIPPPLGGKLRRTNLEAQPPGTVYDSRDFWPIDAKTGMDRLAVRPGFAAYGSQNDVKLIATLSVAPSEASQRLLITAEGTAVYHWAGGTKTSATMTASLANTSRNFQSAPYLGNLYIADDVNPKVYRHASTDVVSLSSLVTAGTAPTNCRLACTWANRIVFAGDTTAPHIWYMSRIGDPLDWLFAADDDGSPVAATDIEGGQIGEPVTSLIPHNRACILFGTANAITVLRNNPVAGGTMERISHVVGPVNPTAYCKTSDDWTYFLTRDGLYRMPPGCGVMPESISREKIPESLLGLDGISDIVYMEYDVRFRCIHIYVEGSNAQAFHYFPQYQAFCPVTVPGSSIRAIGRFDPIETTDKSGVLVGTSSGLKRLDRTAALGGASAAYAKLGPFRLAAMGEKSQIKRVHLKFGDNSDDTSGTVTLYGAGDGEAAVAEPANRSAVATLSELNGYAWHPNVGGQAGFLAIAQADTSKHISYEDGVLYVANRGRERV